MYTSENINVSWHKIREDVRKMGILWWEGKQVLRQRDEYKKGFGSVFENFEATNQLQMKWNKGIEI